MARKLLSILLSVAMVFTFVAMPVSAAGEPTMEITSATGTSFVESTSDQTVTLSVLLHNPNPTQNDIAGISFNLVSDSEYIELASTAKSLTSAFGAGSATYYSPAFTALKMEGMFAKPITDTDVTLITIEATLKANAPVGDYTIRTTEMSVSDTKSNAVYSNNPTITIHITKAPVTITNLQWGKFLGPNELGGIGNTSQVINLPGAFSFDTNSSDGNVSYLPKIYRRGENGEDTLFSEGVPWYDRKGNTLYSDFLLMNNSIRESGTYYFTIQPSIDGELGEIATSPDWEYNKPTRRLASPQELSYDAATGTITWKLPESVSAGDVYRTHTDYSVFDGSGKYVGTYGSSSYYTHLNGRTVTDRINPAVDIDLSAGNYGLKIKATIGSADITRYLDSEAAELTYVGNVNIPGPTLALDSKTSNTITVTANDAWEYTKDNGATVQSSNVFTGLEANTQYSIKARVKETNTTLPSNWSAALTVTTDKLTQTISGPDSVTVTFGKTLDLNTKFSTNVSGNTMTFTEEGTKPVGTTFNAAIGVITAGTTEGSFTVKINAAAKDAYNAAAEKTVTVEIKSLPDPELAWRSSGNLSGTYGGSFTGKTASAKSNGKITYSSSDADTVAVNASTGALTVKKAGAATITAEIAETAAYAGDSITYTVTVSPKELSITGLKAVNRAYDGTTTVTLAGGKLNGVVKTGEVSCVIPTAGTIADANAGTGKAVAVTKPTLSGSNAASYTLADLPAITVDISQADPAIGTVSYTGGDIYPSTTVDAVNAALSRANTTVSGTLALDAVTEFAAGTRNYNWKFVPTDATNYKTVTGKLSLTVKADALESIAASGTLRKTSYEYGDVFDLAGITVTATYASGLTKDVTELVSFGSLSVGQTEMALTYQGKTCTVSGFTVAKKNLDLSALSWNTTGSPFTFDGEEKTVSLSGTVPSGVTVRKTGDSATDAGDYTAKAEFALASGYSADNYQLSGTNPLTISWKINKAAGSSYTAEVKLRYSNTSEQSVDLAAYIPVNCGEISEITFAETSDSDSLIAAVSEDKDAKSVAFTPEVLTEAAVGKSATLTAAVKTANYTDIAVTVTVTITDKDVPTVTAQNISKVYDGETIDASAIKGTAVFDGSNVAGAWSFKGTPALTNVADSGAKTVVFTPEDTDTYDTVETNIAVTISKATPTGTPGYTRITSSGKTLADAALTIGSITPVGGSITWDDGDAAEVKANTAYGWTYVPADTANYSRLTGTIKPYTVSGGGITKPEDKRPEKVVFVDVTTGSWYEDAVNYVVANGLMSGYGNGIFAPGNDLSRAMLAQILYNKENKPGYTGSSVFNDLASGAWYVDAVIWAAENKVIYGYAEDRFGPDDPITREQLATMLWRYAGEPMSSANLDVFNDADRISGYAEPALRWAVEKGIMSGKGNGILDPLGKATRAEVAMMLMRFVELG